MKLQLQYSGPKGAVVLLPILLVFLYGFTPRSFHSNNGFYLIDVEMVSKMRVGDNSMKMSIRRQPDMQPLDEDSVIEIVTWMAVHEHGTSVSSLITPLGDGFYQVDRINFTMPGPWQVHILIRDAEGQEDIAVLAVEVEKDLQGGIHEGMQMPATPSHRMTGH